LFLLLENGPLKKEDPLYVGVVDNRGLSESRYDPFLSSYKRVGVMDTGTQENLPPG
jgi:hypothetical protein